MKEKHSNGWLPCAMPADDTDDRAHDSFRHQLPHPGHSGGLICPRWLSEVVCHRRKPWGQRRGMGRVSLWPTRSPRRSNRKADVPASGKLPCRRRIFGRQPFQQDRSSLPLVGGLHDCGSGYSLWSEIGHHQHPRFPTFRAAWVGLGLSHSLAVRADFPDSESSHVIQT